MAGSGGHRRIRKPMERRRSEFPEQGAVRRRGVSLIARQPVLRKLAIPFPHHRVAGHLGQNRSGGDRNADGVAPDDRDLGNREIEAQGIYQKQVGRGIERQDGLAHGQARCLKDINSVDFRSIYARYGPGDGTAANLGCEMLPPFRGKPLAVPETPNPVRRVKDDRSRQNRTEQRAPPNLIEAGNPVMAAAPTSAFISRPAVDSLSHVKRLVAARRGSF